MNTLPVAARRYLDALEAALAGVPLAARTAILDDVEAHLSDAAADGRDVDATLAALGTPAEVARDAREQLGVDAASDPAERSARFLHWSAVVLALITAAFIIFILPTYVTATEAASTGGASGELVELTTETLFGEHGIGIALLPLIPAALALLPLVLNRPLRKPAGWVVAGAVTVLCVVAGLTIGGFYVPLALVLWAAMLVPLWIKRGRRAVSGRIWRVTGAVIMIVPAAFAFGGLVTGSMADPTPAFWISAIAFLAAGVLFAFRVPFVDAIVTAVGAGLMLLAVFDAGILVLAFWWAGGIWLTAGLSALAARGVVRPLQRSRATDPEVVA